MVSLDDFFSAAHHILDHAHKIHLTEGSQSLLKCFAEPGEQLNYRLKEPTCFAWQKAVFVLLALPTSLLPMRSFIQRAVVKHSLVVMNKLL